ncbi:MAG: Clp protease ClpP, partial [Rikenellaceae bacterium]|nr:Clp protease ClpP [Rikenellaceae bacterium]
MKGYIRIDDRAETGRTVIDIEGVIGVAEQMQFADGCGSVSTYGSLKALLDRAAQTRATGITVNIRSTGGSVQDALLIYDYLRSTGAQVTTHCFGYVASAATIIAQAASPGGREISANALYLIHNSSCEAEGSSGEMAATADMLRQTDERIAAIYASRSGRPAEGFRELMGENGGRGRWLSPEEVVGLGLADTVAGASRIRRSDRRLVRNLMLPPLPARGGWKALLFGSPAGQAGIPVPEISAGRAGIPVPEISAGQVGIPVREISDGQAVNTTETPAVPDNTNPAVPAELSGNPVVQADTSGNPAGPAEPSEIPAASAEE